MQKILNIVPKILVALFMFCMFGPAESQQQHNTARDIENYLQHLANQNHFSGAVLLAKNNRIVLRAGFGYADLEQKIPFTPETRQHVASISKMFTAMTVLKLRDAGKLKLFSSVCTYLPGCPRVWQVVTVQHLLRHSSGIPDYESRLGLHSQAYKDFMSSPSATEKIMTEAKTKPLEFKPGTKYSYSNTGYILLGAIVEAVTAKPFHQAVRQWVLEPAGLNDTDMIETSSSGLAKAYSHGTEALPKLALTGPAGDAALVSTLDDLYRWSKLMDGSRFVPRKLASEVFSPGINDYGYGWFVFRSGGRRFIRHTGELPGYRTVFVKIPALGITAILFSNEDSNDLRGIAKTIVGMLQN